jgi:hypothetical protein
MWNKCLTSYVSPHLPEAWGVSGRLLHYQQNKWIACILTPVHYKGAQWFTMSEAVQFLGAPSTTVNGPLFHGLGSSTGRGVIDMFSDVDDAGPAMAALLSLIESESVPRFREIGTIDGFLEAVVAMYTRSPHDFFYPERICYLEIIRGNLDSAREAGLKTLEATQKDTAPEVREIGLRVAEIVALADRDHAAAIDQLARWADQTWLAISRN